MTRENSHAMQPSRRHRYPVSPPSGFELSLDPTHPSSMMQGHLPDMLRQRNNHAHRALSLMGEGMFDPFEQQLASHRSHPFENMMSPFGNMFSSINTFQSQPQGGYYMSSSSSVMTVDKNGQRNVEHYQKNVCGDHDKNMHEVKEGYSNSATGKDIMALERRKKDKGIQLIRHRDHSTQVIDETQTGVNMDEDEIDDFHDNWKDEFAHVYRSRPQLSISQGGRNIAPARRQLQ